MYCYHSIRPRYESIMFIARSTGEANVLFEISINGGEINGYY